MEMIVASFLPRMFCLSTSIAIFSRKVCDAFHISPGNWELTPCESKIREVWCPFSCYDGSVAIVFINRWYAIRSKEKTNDNRTKAGGAQRAALRRDQDASTYERLWH